MIIYGALTNFIVEIFSGALNTLTELHLHYLDLTLTPSTFEQLCAECVSLKTFIGRGKMSEDLLSHVSKLKTLENLELENWSNHTISITPFVFEQICTECVYLKTLHFGRGFGTSGNSFRGWTSSNMKDLQLDYLSEINLQVR